MDHEGGKMEKKQFIQLMDEKIKLIRTEYGLSQDKMAVLLGISKKTLIEIEKKRKSLGWTNSVALASIFSDSTIIRDAIGGDTSGFIIALEDDMREKRLPYSTKSVFTSLSTVGSGKSQNICLIQFKRNGRDHGKDI